MELIRPSEVKLVGTEYIAYVFGKEINKGKNLIKVTTKVLAYLKGQS